MLRTIGREVVCALPKMFFHADMSAFRKGDTLFGKQMPLEILRTKNICACQRPGLIDDPVAGKPGRRFSQSKAHITG